MGCGCRGGGPKKIGPKRISRPVGQNMAFQNRGLHVNVAQPQSQPQNPTNSPIVPIRALNPNPTTDRERMERLKREAMERVQGKRIF